MIVISEKTLDVFRKEGDCELCGRYCARRHPHHLLTRGHGGGSRLDIRANLAGLCYGCHERFGDDPAWLWTFLGIVSRREGFSGPQAVKEYLDLVLRTDKYKPMPMAPVCPF